MDHKKLSLVITYYGQSPKFQGAVKVSQEFAGSQLPAAQNEAHAQVAQRGDPALNLSLSFLTKI